METDSARLFFRHIGQERPTHQELADVAVLLDRGKRDALAPERFAEHVASHCTNAEELGTLHIEDVALALASARGEREAVQEIERTMIEPLPKALARLKPDPRVVDELRQAMRESLLVGPVGGRPKLLEYKGRGPLAAWVRVVAMRMAYDHLRSVAQKTRDEDVDAFETLVDSAEAADIVHLKTKYAAEIKMAFREAAATLAPEERAVLRAQAVDGLTVDQMGVLFQVHRATAARWASHARVSLLSALRDALARRLGMEHDACESLVALVRSRIDLSLERAFAPDELL